MIVRSAMLLTTLAGLAASPRAAAADPMARSTEPNSAPAGNSASDPIAALERELPAGWSLLATDRELVLRHDHAVYAAASAGSPAADDMGPLVSLELRYRHEPRWSMKQLAAARLTDAKLDAQQVAARLRYRIDAIPVVDGEPRPTTAADRARVAAWQRIETAITGKRIAIPVCALGDHSVFDGPGTYAELARPLDPASANREGHAVVELVKRHCTAE
jgi:hypothetical protein